MSTPVVSLVANATSTRRPSDYQEHISKLQERLLRSTSEITRDFSHKPVTDDQIEEKTVKITGMHGVIQTTIGQIQDKTQQILQDQERDLIRAFRSRLAQVQDELDQERRKNESGSAEWVSRCHKLTEELDWLRELTDKLSAENTLFIKENKRYARQLESQDNDRTFLLKQLVAVKRENAKLKLMMERCETDVDNNDHSNSMMLSSTTNANKPISRQSTQNKAKSITQSLPYPNVLNQAAPTRASTSRITLNPYQRDMGNAATPANSAEVQSLRRDVNTLRSQTVELQRELKRSETKVRQLQTKHFEELASKSSLFDFFKQAVDDVRFDINDRRLAKLKLANKRSQYPTSLVEQSQTPPLDPRDIPLSDFTVQDRINVLEWMLSQDSVIYFLYEQLFPRQTHAANVNSARGVNMSRVMTGRVGTGLQNRGIDSSLTSAEVDVLMKTTDIYSRDREYDHADGAVNASPSHGLQRHSQGNHHGEHDQHIISEHNFLDHDVFAD